MQILRAIGKVVRCEQDLTNGPVKRRKGAPPSIHEEWLAHGRNGLEDSGLGGTSGPLSDGRPSGRDGSRRNEYDLAPAGHVSLNVGGDIGEHGHIHVAASRRH